MCSVKDRGGKFDRVEAPAFLPITIRNALRKASREPRQRARKYAFGQPSVLCLAVLQPFRAMTFSGEIP